jgi:Flp pilus assembly protein TadD
VSITSCSTCGHLPSARAVTEAENNKEHGNDAFEWAQYDVALQRYSQEVERAPHDAKLRSNRTAVYMPLQ